MQPVTISGHRFVSGGQPFSYVGIDGFGLFKRWLMPDGPNALVRPWLQEHKAIAALGGYAGPIVVRVFRYAAPPNSFALDPWGYMAPNGQFPALTAFLAACEEEGFYVDLTSGDSQIVLPTQSGQQEHLNRTCAALAGCPNVFLETCNEPFKNGIDVGAVVPPQWGPYLRDSGYYSEIQGWQARMNLDFISYHGGRGDGGLVVWPKWLIDLDDQLATLLSAFGKPVVLKEPIGFAESNQPGRRSNQPDHAYRLGLTVAYGGVLFHSDDGIDCNSPRPVQRACEVAFFQGVKGGLTR